MSDIGPHAETLVYISPRGEKSTINRKGVISMQTLIHTREMEVIYFPRLNCSYFLYFFVYTVWQMKGYLMLTFILPLKVRFPLQLNVTHNTQFFNTFAMHFDLQKRGRSWNHVASGTEDNGTQMLRTSERDIIASGLKWFNKLKVMKTRHPECQRKCCGKNQRASISESISYVVIVVSAETAQQLKCSNKSVNSEKYAIVCHIWVDRSSKCSTFAKRKWLSWHMRYHWSVLIVAIGIGGPVEFLQPQNVLIHYTVFTLNCDSLWCVRKAKIRTNSRYDEK